MRTRIILGAMVIAGLIGVFGLDRSVGDGWVLCGLALLAAGWGFTELSRLIDLGAPMRVATAIAVPATIVCATDWRSFVVAVVGVPAALAAASLQASEPRQGREQLSRALLAWAYLGLGASALVLLRNSPSGWALVITTLVATKFADIGAYFTGRAIGKTPLIPRLSPKKTVEGLVGGLALAALGAVVLGVLVFDLPRFGWGVALLFGVVVGAVGTLGDLVESQFKRAAAEKDSGSVLPEFGGMLDMIDSPLLAAPAACAFIVVLG